MLAQLQEQERERKTQRGMDRLFQEAQRLASDPDWDTLNEKIKGVNPKIESFVNNLINTTKVTDARKHAIEGLRNRLKDDLARSLGHHDIDVVLYGSHYTGLATMESDVDFILMDHRDPTKYSVRIIEKALREAGYRIDLVLDKTRVPIVTFFDPTTEITCDICVNELMGLENSKLIKTYIQMDERLLPVFIGLRHLAKLHDIYGGRQQRLSSYALTLMLISYFQMCLILPRLQQQSPEKMIQKTVDGWDCSFDPDWKSHQAAIADKGMMVTGDFPELLRSFCTFHTHGLRYASFEANIRVGMYNFHQPRDVSFAKTAEAKQKLMEAPICARVESMKRMMDNVDGTLKDFIKNLVIKSWITKGRKRLVDGLRNRVHSDLAHFDIVLYGSHFTGLASMDSEVDLILMDRRDPTKYSIRVITCNICVNEPMGLGNSKLVKTYVQIDDRFLTVFFTVRYLADMRQIRNGQKQLLSSCALTLMVMSCFQMRKIFPTAAATADTANFSTLLRNFFMFLAHEFQYGTYEANIHVGTYNPSEPREVSFAKTEEEKKRLMEAPICAIIHMPGTGM
ncbi:hypothetical protein BGZ83_009608 [Gryganskiella cystojenkinii]|nr:hypothetical protein BGZ83_009608 [Gryganskiella cystojenkinii]